MASEQTSNLTGKRSQPARVSLRLRLEVAVWRYGYCLLIVPALLVANLAVWVVASQIVVLDAQAVEGQAPEARVGAAQALQATSEHEVARTIVATADVHGAAGRGTVDTAPTTRLPIDWRALPGQSDLLDLVDQLTTSLKVAGVTYGPVDLSHDPVGPSGLGRAKLTFTVQGQYPSLRTWMQQSLSSVPAMSVDRLALRRTQVSDESLEGQLQISLWYFDAADRKSGRDDLNARSVSSNAGSLKQDGGRP